jgi:hypothetical protein
MLHIIHPQKSKLIFLPIKNNSQEPNFYGTLILKHTPKRRARGEIQDKTGRKGRLQGAEEFIYFQGVTVVYCGKT